MFEKSWKEEVAHGEKFINYVIKRGGSVITPEVAVIKTSIQTVPLEKIFETLFLILETSQRWKMGKYECM